MRIAAQTERELQNLPPEPKLEEICLTQERG